MVHLQENGFEVETHDVAGWDALATIRTEHGVPADFAGCHTAVIDGYVVEGHVPASAIGRMLEDRPPILGLTVPGMPAGSPGMEGPPPESYDVLAIDSTGSTVVYERH